MQRVNLNDDWYVYPRDDAFSLVTSIPSDAVHTSVPYDALWHEGQTPKSINAGRTGHFDGQVYYFHRELILDEAWREKRLILKFDGVFCKSFVYVNGSLVGSGDFGYASLTCDITNYVRFDAPNVLLVVCKCDLLSSRWYAGCGIVRPVTLFVAEPVHVALDSLFVHTESLADNSARLRVRATIQNDGPTKVVDARLRIADETHTLLDECFPLRVGSSYELDRRFYLRGIRPWSEDDPHRYDVTLTVGADETHLRCGLRTESWDPVHGLTINGRPVLLRGACIHHDEGILGGVSLSDFERWRVARMKEAGFNAIRSAHNHASAELLDACDELGVYVLDEVCDMWTKMKGFGDFAQYFGHSWCDVVDSMAREDRNHPCVVGYSTGNEISDINTERGFEVAHELYSRFHMLDDTRFVTNGVNGAFAAGEELADIACDLTGQPREVFESGDVNKFMGLMATRMADITTHPVVSRVLDRLDSCVDVQGYNYMTARYAGDSDTYPQRVMLGTETYPRQVAQNWTAITAHPSCIGEFTWTGWDYIGELGGAAYPAWRNDSGDINTFGFRRPTSYWREIVFGLRTAPYLAVRPPEAHGTPRMFGPWKFTDAQPSWTWEVPEGTVTTVEVYAPAGEVSLYLDDELVGTEKTTECYALFEVPYRPGCLRAVTAAGEACELRTVDTATVRPVAVDATHGELVFSQIHLEDAAGTWALGSGQTYDASRDDLTLLAVGSEHTTPSEVCGPTVAIHGLGALAIYRR